MRHGKYEPGPIPTFWTHEMTLGKITELEYYKHIYPRTIIKEFLDDWAELDNELTLEGKVRVQREKIVKWRGRVK